jgi:hypothetical protein
VVKGQSIFAFFVVVVVVVVVREFKLSTLELLIY